jgi:hypothetical protein
MLFYELELTRFHENRYPPRITFSVEKAIETRNPDKVTAEPCMRRESVRFSSSLDGDLTPPRRCGRIAGCRAFNLPQGTRARLFAARQVWRLGGLPSHDEERPMDPRQHGPMAGFGASPDDASHRHIAERTMRPVRGLNPPRRG